MPTPALQARAPQPKYPYLTCCVESDAESIDEMCDQAHPVSFRTFSSRCHWQDWAHMVGYVIERGAKGIRLNKDYHVRFYRSRFQGKHCYYIVWSAIEVIFAQPSPSHAQLT